MKRREFLGALAAGGAAGLMRGVLPRGPRAAGAETPARADRPAGRPNVVLIISDDQGWGDYGFMGHPVIRTPRLDRLAAQSLVLTRGYVPTALCRPSLATLSTGLYPHQHRIVGNDPKGGSRNLPGREEMIRQFARSPLLARRLGEAGYVSFQSGKWWEGPWRTGGFTGGMTHGDPKRGGRHGDAGLTIGRKGLKCVLDFISAAGEKPFFVWYAPFLPHLPHNPPKRLLSKYTAADRPNAIARYFAMCEWFDETCGQLLDHLDRESLAEKTLVVYLADNGWVQGTRRGGAVGGRRGKRTCYEGGVRTPIMVRWPGRIKPRRDEKTLASSIDVAPTILSACGLKPAPQMPGLNLLDTKALAGRTCIFGEAFAHDIVELSDPASSLRQRWCIDGRWKLIVPHKAKLPKAKVELYDVLADPHEKANLAGKHPERVSQLRERIDRWWPVK